MPAAGRIAAPPPWMRAAETLTLLQALRAEGASVRFVGGAVRDAVLGRSNQDVDLAIDRPPVEILRLLEAAGIRALATGLAHGTVTALVADPSKSEAAHFEITSLRRDVETFGRHARVVFTDDWAADAARRDFTMNALYADEEGVLYDPTGGLEDLMAGRVRFVGAPERRIAEDRLRLLRFFRFHAYYGRGRADDAAYRACSAAAKALAELPGERLWGEFRRLLLAPGSAPAETVALMAAGGVLDHLLPPRESPWETARAEIDILDRLCRLEDLAALPNAIRRLAALLVTPEAAELAAARLRLARREGARLCTLLEPRPGVTPAFPWPMLHRLIYRAGREAACDRILLHWARAGGVTADEGWRALLAHAEGWLVPEFPVQGADVLAQGVAPGPEIGRLLARLEQGWEEADFRPPRPDLLAELKRLCGR